jgi:7-cyano-7-deazaguanine synthase in queuosine biosynthesis
MPITAEDMADLVALTLESRPHKDLCWVCFKPCDEIICPECDEELKRHGI